MIHFHLNFAIMSPGLVELQAGVVSLDSGLDDHLVGFEPNDPENALNWPSTKKWLIVLTLAAMTFVVYVS